MVEAKKRRRRGGATAVESVTRVNTETRTGGVEDAVLTDEQGREVHRFGTDPAFVRVAAGQTISTGNYESLRIDVSISMPCYKENVDEVYENLAEDVAEKLSNEAAKWLEG